MRFDVEIYQSDPGIDDLCGLVIVRILCQDDVLSHVVGTGAHSDGDHIPRLEDGDQAIVSDVGNLRLKHDFQHETALCISNGAFKGAMQAAGFSPKDEREINAVYKIRQPKRQKAPRGLRAKEHGFHVEYDSTGGASVTRSENGAIRPP